MGAGPHRRPSQPRVVVATYTRLERAIQHDGDNVALVWHSDARFFAVLVRGVAPGRHRRPATAALTLRSALAATRACRHEQTRRGAVVLCAITPVDTGSAPALVLPDSLTAMCLGAGEGRGVPARTITLLTVVRATEHPFTCLLGGRDGVLAPRPC